MADESVTAANMPDSGSPQSVALDMARRIQDFSPEGTFGTKEGFLNLYAECLLAAMGRRPIS